MRNWYCPLLLHYKGVSFMNAVGITLSPQLIAELGMLPALLTVKLDSLIKRSPVDDPVYAFMDKKRAQGKPYYVYMTAGANKFLRIYYGRVREYLSTLPENEKTNFILSFIQTSAMRWSCFCTFLSTCIKFSKFINSCLTAAMCTSSLFLH